MAFLKYANARVEKNDIEPDDWNALRRERARDLGFQKSASGIQLDEYSPDKYLLSHCTIIASVDVDEVANVKTGSNVVHQGRKINRPHNDYYVKPETSQYINQNNDCWERELLLSTYKTFVGAENYLEHIQMPELSKGKVIDAVARDLGDSVYVDILVATDRKHTDLIASINSGEINTLSMGCSIAYSICTKCGNKAADETELCHHVKYQKGNTFIDEKGKQRPVAELCFPGDERVVLENGQRVPISDIQEGDRVITHTGDVKPVVETYERDFEGDLVELDITGFPDKIKSTPNHPYWVMSPNEKCACGCGQDLGSPSCFSKEAYERSYCPGHNPNQEATLDSPAFEFKKAGEIKKGDIVALPAPKGEEKPEGLTHGKSELLGWFLAEGSYTKNSSGQRTGISFTLNGADERSVARRLQALLEREFEPEFSNNCSTQPRVFGFLKNHKGEEFTKKTVAKELGISSNSANLALQRLRKKDLVKSRPATYQDKELLKGASVLSNLWSIQEGVEAPQGWFNNARLHQYERAEGGTDKLVVCYINQKATDWLFERAGEYSHKKKMSREVMFWPYDYQETLLRAYVQGDGTVDKQGRHSVTTTSLDLFDQMQMIAARCGIWSRRSVVHEGQSSSVKEASGRDTNNFLPSYCLYFKPSEDTDEFFEMREVQERPRAGHWRKQDNYCLYKIKGTGLSQYEGRVYNLAVGGINSYLVDGIAVHNCGHKTDPESVTFIEASWVANPAFKGAVLRNILNGEDVDLSDAQKEQAKEKLLSAHQISDSRENNISSLDDFLKSAAYSNQRMKTDSYPTNKHAGWGDDEEEEEDTQEEDKDVAEEIKEQLIDDIANKALQKAREKLDGPDPKHEDGSEPDQMNDNIIHAYQAFESKYASMFSSKSRLARVFNVIYSASKNKKGWSALKESSQFDNRDVLAALYIKESREQAKPPSPLYECLLKVGGKSNYRNEKTFLRTCELALGRQTTRQEQRWLIQKSKFLQ